MRPTPVTEDEVDLLLAERALGLKNREGSFLVIVAPSGRAREAAAALARRFDLEVTDCRELLERRALEAALLVGASHEVVGAAFVQTGNTVKMMVVTLGQVITGTRSVKEMGGPLKIAQYSGQQASLGWLDLILFMSLISINLGFINLLPVPMLDGGHLLFYGIEAVRRRPVSLRVQDWAFRGGLALILALLVFTTLNDLDSFGLWDRLGRLIG